jgi:xanthine dehydrogenase accessory factor
LHSEEVRMTRTFFERITQLARDGARFVTATVVSRRAPVSSHLGDRALVFEDGRMEGFVGGSCSREIVRKQALEVLALGKPRLVLIRPDATQEASQHAANAESIVVPMTCASEGAVDVYLEPHVPPRVLLVAGFTPVAQAVTRFGHSLEYRVVRVVTREEARDLEPETAVALPDLGAFLEGLTVEARRDLAAVVASQGHYDEPVLEAVLLADVGFVSLLASRKRAATVRELLELQGVSAQRVASVRNPAGLDINAKTPAEVAVSILAEIIAARDDAKAPPMFTHSRQDALEKKEATRLEVTNPAPSSLTPRPGYAISPVDGEEIEMATAVHFADLGGVTYYFTCANCKRRFLKDPAKYLESRAGVL